MLKCCSLRPSSEGLTPRQDDIPVALMEAGHPLTRTEFSEAAKVDRKTVWSAFRTPAFVETHNQVCLLLLKERVGGGWDAEPVEDEGVGGRGEWEVKRSARGEVGSARVDGNAPLAGEMGR